MGLRPPLAAGATGRSGIGAELGGIISDIICHSTAQRLSSGLSNVQSTC